MANTVDPRRERSWKSFAAGVVAGLALAGMKRGTGRRATRAAGDKRFGAPPRADGEPTRVDYARAREAGRGREATKPTEIPKLGWKDIFWRTYEQINKDRVLSVAAGVVFYVVLALFPAITALVSIYGLVADPATIREQIGTLGSVVPADALNIIREQIERISSNSGGSLGLASVFGILVALWSANAGMKAVIDALNVAYDEEEKRSFIRLTLVSLVFTLGAMAFLLLAMGAMVVLPIVLGMLGLGSVAATVVNILRWPVMFIVVMTGIAILYRFGPSRNKPTWRWVSPGTVIATLGWIIGSLLFSWYLTNFANYNATYGSLGAAIGMMTWLWLSAIMILMGAEVNAEIEHQTAHDTTDERQKPMGARGATVADTVGEAQT